MLTSGLTIKDNAGEYRLFKSRVAVASLLVGFLSLMLIGQLMTLQVIDHEHLKTLSHNNRVKIVPLVPTRGLIFDRNGVVMAQNTPSYSLEIVPEAVVNMDTTIKELREVIRIEDIDEERFRRLLKKKRPFQSVPLRFRLGEAEVASFSVNRHRFPGVDLHAHLAREYPLGAVGVHAIGYVARINEQELQNVDATDYRGTTHIGKTGVEQAYEKALHGRVGYQHVETNAEGRTLRVLARTPPIPGSNLYLTIDASLQAMAEASLDGENGAVVAIDPRTGGVLALASQPGFDPNLFVNGIDPDTYHALLTSPDRPLFNRPLAGRYPPGSTVKPFMGLAGLERDVRLTRQGTWCSGWYRLTGHPRKYRDWKKEGHGRVDLKKAIVESCDVYFYELALSLGIDHMHDVMSQFGFGRETGIDVEGEVAGLMPSTAWKRRARQQPWFPGETLITGIGQGFTLATPLQLASATATLAMRGVRLQPRLVDRMQAPRTGKMIFLPPVSLGTIAMGESAHWDTIIGAMVNVVHNRRGTARRISLDAEYRIAGKTGTSQVFSVGQGEKYDAAKVAKKLRDHALFVAFAPADDPRIAVAIVVENGGSGSNAAAPIARQVMDHYLAGNGGGDNEGLLLTSHSEPNMPATGESERSPRSTPDVHVRRVEDPVNGNIRLSEGPHGG